MPADVTTYGTLVNRWAKARAKYPEDESVRWRYERTQEWIVEEIARRLEEI